MSNAHPQHPFDATAYLDRERQPGRHSPAATSRSSEKTAMAT
jgi:hypothetical protein